MQADHLSLDVKELQPFIATIAPSDERARAAQAMLLSWNAVMDKDRAEPLIYTAFLRSLHKILIDDKTGLSMEEKGPFAATTLVSLMRDHPSWCDVPGVPDPDCRKTLGRALDNAIALLSKRDGLDMSRWRWGAEHRALLRHQVYSHVPLFDWLSDLSVPSSGGFYTLDRGGGSDVVPDLPFARTHGGGFRGLYDLADRDKSRFMIATGKFGPHLFAPLRRPHPAVERRQIDHACGLGRRAQKSWRARVDAQALNAGAPRQPHARRNPAVAGALSSG